MHARFALTVLALTTLVGCAGNGDSAPRPAQQSDAGAARLTGDRLARVEKAAQIANEVGSRPNDAARILSAHGMTEQQFEELMYEIAADPAMSAEYDARVR
jgi:hypothetical protein